jgi:carbamoyl-phosphate synthase large subunit
VNVLITSASRKVALVRSFQQAFTKYGGEVIAVDASPLAAALYSADEYALVPRSDSPDFLDAMLELCTRKHIGLIVPTRDEELPLFARYRPTFAEQGVTVLVAAPEVIERCQDKRQFQEFCRAHGFNTPAPVDWATPGPEPLALFIKPRRGKGSAHAQRVDSLSALEALSSHADELVLQRFVAAPEYTVDLFSDFAGRVISVVPRERMLVVGGESFIARTVRIPEISEQSIKLAQALGLVGHNAIQCFFDGKLVQFIEVNARYGGGANLGFAAGANTPAFLADLLHGAELEPQIGAYQEDLVMLRFTDDVFLHQARGESMIVEKGWVELEGRK